MLKNLYNGQYGFRKKPIPIATLELVAGLTTALNNSCSSIVVYIFKKKAFNTVYNSILLQKLEHHGIRIIA